MRQIKIFISYSHADLEHRPGYMESRVERIMDEAIYDLARDSPRSPFKILRDKRIAKPSENFRKNIAKAIVECDMAIAFLSPSYCASEECELEFRRLVDLKKPLFLVDTEPAWLTAFEHNRIAPYRKELRDIVFVQFWEKGKNEETVLFGYPLPTPGIPTAAKYYQSLQRLVDGVKTTARQLLGNDASEEREDARSTIFLACPTSDVKPYAMQLATALEQDKHAVIIFDPELALGEKSSFSEVVGTQLAKCDAYIQLLGALQGRAVRDTDSRLVPAQYQMAVKSGKPIYLWQSSGFDAADCEPNYGAFLKEIARSCHIGTYLDFEKYLRKRLNDVDAQRQSVERRTQRSQQAGTKLSWPFVAIDAARSDRELAQKITDALASYANVSNLPYDLTNNSFAKEVEHNNALVLAYGKSAEGQKRTRAHFRLIRRHAADMVFKDLELAVGNGAPATALPPPRGPNVHVIRVADKVDSAAMFDFLKRLGVSVPQGNEAH
jgi:TIR domain